MKRFAIAPLVAVWLLAACGGGAADPATGTIEITGEDYSFAGVPELVASGAEFTFTNGSEIELHEMVVVRVVDGENRSLDELLALPEAESESLVEFQGILIAFPGEAGVSPEDPASVSVTLGDPGRYVLLCFIPQGADPEAFRVAMESDAEVDLGDGPPHSTLGMAAEFTVEGDA